MLSCRRYQLVPCLSVIPLCASGIGGYNVRRQVGRLQECMVTLIRQVQEAIVLIVIIIVIVIIVIIAWSFHYIVQIQQYACLIGKCERTYTILTKVFMTEQLNSSHTSLSACRGCSGAKDSTTGLWRSKLWSEKNHT